MSNPSVELRAASEAVDKARERISKAEDRVNAIVSERLSLESLEGDLVRAKNLLHQCAILHQDFTAYWEARIGIEDNVLLQGGLPHVMEHFGESAAVEVGQKLLAESIERRGAIVARLEAEVSAKRKSLGLSDSE